MTVNFNEIYEQYFHKQKNRLFRMCLEKENVVREIKNKIIFENKQIIINIYYLFVAYNSWKKISYKVC